MVARLLDMVPALGSRATYFEPFVGAGSLFFALAPEIAVLGDANPHLIDLYRNLARAPERFIASFRKLAASDSELDYYRVRDEFNAGRSSTVRAARLLYLNRTCFNGVFRVNRAGKFNVPYGHKARPVFPSREELLAAAGALSKVQFVAASFEKSVRHAKRGDFVYLDPPYPPLSGTSFFTHYTVDRFTEFDQLALADCFAELHGRGCKLLMSNADTPFIRSLYARYATRKLSVIRWVSSASAKNRVRELIVSNY